MSKELLRRIRRHVANVDVQHFKTYFQPFFILSSLTATPYLIGFGANKNPISQPFRLLESSKPILPGKKCQKYSATVRAEKRIFEHALERHQVHVMK